MAIKAYAYGHAPKHDSEVVSDPVVWSGDRPRKQKQFKFSLWNVWRAVCAGTDSGWTMISMNGTREQVDAELKKFRSRGLTVMRVPVGYTPDTWTQQTYLEKISGSLSK